MMLMWSHGLYSYTIIEGLFNWEEDRKILEGSAAFEFRVLEQLMQDALANVAEPLRVMVKEVERKKKRFLFW